MSARPVLDALAADPHKALAEIAAERARRSGVNSFSSFVKQAWPIFDPSPLRWNWYLDSLCVHLEAVARGTLRRLVGNGPPRLGKSNVFAILWPAWVWTWKPTEKFIFLSYSDTLAKEHSISCRRVLESDWYRTMFKPAWALAEDRNTQNAFGNTAGGARYARSIHSGVMGLGATRVCVDDPLDADEALTSAAAREEALRVVQQAVATRMNDRATGAAVILCHRVHPDDPAQWAIEQGWEHLIAPMEYDPEVTHPTYHVVDGERRELWRDPRTTAGELLDPGRFSANDVAEIKLTLGPVKAPAQLGQRPVRGNGAGKYFRADKIAVLDEAPAESEIEAKVRAWDLAATEGGGDWTVGVLLARLRNRRLVILDVKRRQLGPHGVRELIEKTARDDGEEVTISLPQDPGQAGKDQGVDYVGRLVGYAVKLRRPDRKKELRAGPASAQVMGGNVAMVRAPWNSVFVGYLEAFPSEGVADDDVDAFSDAVAEVALAEGTTMDEWGDGAVDERDGWEAWR